MSDQTVRGRVLFILPVLGQPRDAKRVAMLQSSGFDVSAVAFDRPHYRGRLPECPVDVLATIDHGHYLRRALTFLLVGPRLRRAMRQVDVVYASGPDMALAAIMAGVGLGTSVVFEVGDIRRAQVANGPFAAAVRVLDRLCATTAKLIVSTSAAFIDEYYRGRLAVETQALVIENKLESTDKGVSMENDADRARIPLSGRDPIRIGYFGLLRCEWSWRVLEALATSLPDRIEIVAAGRPVEPKDLPLRVERLPNARFLGEYRSPEDLPMLYGSVDIVWATAPVTDTDERHKLWARANRFYESCFFSKPLIVLAGSSDGIDVDRYDIGMTIVGGVQIEQAVAVIASITTKDMLRWTTNLRKLPRSIYEYSTEGEQLGGLLDDIIAGND